MKTSPDNRLLYFCSSWSGGIADYAHEQAIAIGKQGVSVTLLTSPLFQKEKTDYYQLLPILTSSRSFQSSIALLKKVVLGWQIIESYLTLAHVIRQQNFKYVLLETYSEYLAPLWSHPLRKLAQDGVKFGAIVHDPVRNYVVGPVWWHRWSIACGYSFLREAFVHEPIELDTVKPMPSLCCHLVPIGKYSFQPVTSSKDTIKSNLKIPLNSKIIISFGQIRDNKNLDLALKALSQVFEQNVYLIVAGKVSSSQQKTADYYQNLASNLQVNDRCRWLLQFLTEEEVASLFNASDLVLLTYSSTFRSASSVLNVAVNYKRPCLASSGQGNLKTVVEKYGLGIFVEPDSSEAIECGLQKWLDGEMPTPLWEQYEEENSWQRNAEIVIDRLFKF